MLVFCLVSFPTDYFLLLRMGFLAKPATLRCLVVAVKIIVDEHRFSPLGGSSA